MNDKLLGMLGLAVRAGKVSFGVFMTEKLVEGMEAEDEEGEAEYDEHVWTSPTNAIKITNAILNAMCEKDGNNCSSDSKL